MKGRTYRYMSDALFPFGYGLSYTTFSVGEANLDNKTMTLTLPVSNTGNYDGTEVVQIYIHKTGDTDGPIKTLKAFQRVSLKAGQHKNVVFKLDKKAFEFFDHQTNTMRVDPRASYEIYYGNSSRDCDLKKVVIAGLAE
jgi:beta-glucosidase